MSSLICSMSYISLPRNDRESSTVPWTQMSPGSDQPPGTDKLKERADGILQQNISSHARPSTLKTRLGTQSDSLRRPAPLQAHQTGTEGNQAESCV